MLLRRFQESSRGSQGVPGGVRGVVRDRCKKATWGFKGYQEDSGAFKGISGLSQGFRFRGFSKAFKGV